MKVIMLLAFLLAIKEVRIIRLQANSILLIALTLL